MLKLTQLAHIHTHTCRQMHTLSHISVFTQFALSLNRSHLPSFRPPSFLPSCLYFQLILIFPLSINLPSLPSYSCPSFQLPSIHTLMPQLFSSDTYTHTTAPESQIELVVNLSLQWVNVIINVVIPEMTKVCLPTVCYLCASQCCLNTLGSDFQKHLKSSLNGQHYLSFLSFLLWYSSLT